MNRRIAALPAVVAVACGAFFATAAPASAKPAHHFKNCTDLRRTYPHGVGRTNAHDHVVRGNKPVTNFKRNNALYAANKGSDRDHDGISCEQH